MRQKNSINDAVIYILSNRNLHEMHYTTCYGHKVFLEWAILCAATTENNKLHSLSLTHEDKIYVKLWSIMSSCHFPEPCIWPAVSNSLLFSVFIIFVTKNWAIWIPEALRPSIPDHCNLIRKLPNTSIVTSSVIHKASTSQLTTSFIQPSSFCTDRRIPTCLAWTRLSTSAIHFESNELRMVRQDWNFSKNASIAA